MTESTISKNDVRLEASIPEGAASLESILCTEELRRRPSRPPDYEKENRALVALASALADSPLTILQTLAETILEVTRSDSSGLSLLTTDDGGRRFYWPAIAGRWKPHIGGGTLRNFGPCGDVLDRSMPLLFRHFERRYAYLAITTPPAEECLLVPFYVRGKAVGTIWAIMHDDHRKFDAEDERLMIALGKFASAAYQTLASIDDLKLRIGEREQAETALRELTKTLERGVRVSTEELEQGIAERRRAEDGLRRSEAYFTEAQRLSLTGSFGWNVYSGELIWSKETFSILEYDEATKPRLDLVLKRVHPDDIALVRETIERAAQDESDFDFEHRLLMPDGSIKHVHVVARAIRAGTGAVEFVGAVMDVTERKKSQDALRGAKARFEGILGIAEDAIISVDANHRIALFNQGAEKVFGYTQTEMVGKPLDLLLPQRFISAHRKHLEEFAQSADIARVMGQRREVFGVRKNGQEFPAEASISKLDLGGELVFTVILRDISERKRMEEVLREKEARLQAILDHSPAIIFLKDLGGRYVLGNRQFEKVTRVPPDEVVGKTDDELFPREQAADYKANDRKVLQADASMEFEEVAAHADGPHTSIVFKFPLRDPEGRTYAVGGIATDITERKRAQGELLALKDELAAELTAMTRLHELSTRMLASTELQPLLEEVLDATIALLNADFGNVQLYNPQTQALEIVAQRGFPPEFLDHFRSVDDHGAACGRALQQQERIIIEDVQTDPRFEPHRQVAALSGFRAVQSTPLFSRRGETLGMISSHFRQPHRPSERELRLADLYARQAAQVIEHKRADEALRASEERFRRYFELGLIGMAMTSPAKGCLEVNDELCRILGYERSELLQKNWVEMTHPDDLAADIAQFDRVMDGVIDGYALDKRWIRKDGRVIDTIMAAKCLRRADGSVDYFVGLVQDVTERKRAEEALRAAQEELAHVTRVMSMGELTASIAHEVNQPLSAIVANADACLRWLVREEADLDEARAAVKRIIRDGNLAGDVVRQIREFTKKAFPQKARLDVNGIIQAALALAHNEVAGHQVSLRLELSPALPAALGDRVQLQQVLLNLVMNGIDAMKAVTERPRELVISSDSDSSGELFVAVQDSGIGLAPHVMARLFDPFFTTKPEGMGLGLSISRRIVEAHGGQLWATPNDDHGVTFFFTLPTTP